MVLNLLWFLWVVRNFEYKAVEHPSMRTAPATSYKAPAWAQPQVVSGVQPANVRPMCLTADLFTHMHAFCGCPSLHCVCKQVCRLAILHLVQLAALLSLSHTQVDAVGAWPWCFLVTLPLAM